MRYFFPRPRSTGIFILLITLLGFTAGYIRNELALTLVGTLFLTVSAYCFAGIFVLAGIHRKRALAVSARIVTKSVSTGKTGEVLFSPGPLETRGNGKFFRLPGILIRYEITLKTKDGRSISHIFDPDFLTNGFSSFNVPERGAYYSAYDEFILSDILGFFRLAFPISQDGSPRLLASPAAAEEAIPVILRSGGTEQRSDPHFLRTDDLIDHRPYIPGDDPRRINWKLYGHAGDLFVREGEPEPPPHSKLLIMVDTQTDRTLFDTEAGRRAVDTLCENALAAALENAGQGMDIFIGYTGGTIREGPPAELAAALAYPAALPFSGPEELPQSPEDRGILILALPRNSAESSALDRFLKKRGSHQKVDLVFLYREDKPKGKVRPGKKIPFGGENRLTGAAETCAALYRQKGGVHVRCARL
jgi:hypothetical protein